MSNYWDERKDLNYYKVATDFVKKYNPHGSLLEVGGNISGGCKYLEACPNPIKVAVEQRWGIDTIAGVDLHFCDFMTWEPPQHFDIAVCLQCIEHVENPKAFLQKLLTISDIQVVSVPYLWDPTPDHVSNHISEETIEAWADKKPIESEIVRDFQRQRIVMVFKKDFYLEKENHD